MTRVTILGMAIIPGNEVVKGWRIPIEKIRTNLGTFLADGTQNSFMGKKGTEVEVYFNKSVGFEWISFMKKDLKIGLMHGAK